MVAIGVMEALTPAPVAHIGVVSTQQSVGTASCGLPLLKQNASVAFGLRGDFRQYPSAVGLVASSFRVGGGRRQWERSAVNVSAIDAAQPFDYESKRSQELEKSSKLKVGIVGFGNFGQFLAERMVKQGHQVLAHSRRDYGEKARELGVTYFRSVLDCSSQRESFYISLLQCK